MSETYSNMQSVDTELISTINESVLLAANQDVLNKLGDNNGNLTYDGKVVGGRQTETVTLESNDFYPVDTDVSYTTMIIVNNTSKIPENSEITSIELNSGTADSPVWIDARDMIVDYPTAPYVLSFNRFKLSTLYGGYLLVSIHFPLQTKNDLIISLDNYEIPQIRVTYYI